MDRAVAGKMWPYADRCEAEGLAYIPLAVDIFRRWHELALQTIGRLALQLARATNGELGVVRRHLRQRLAVLFVRDNMAMLGARVPSFAPQELDGDADSGWVLLANFYYSLSLLSLLHYSTL